MALIENVADTARWMAAYRAAESARPDALFADALAARLAGDRGRAMAADAPLAARGGWPWVTRARIIDDLVRESIAQGCDRVLNLAAGFDTRPFRLDLPASLTWIEADLPELMAEKERLLSGETPRCTLVRESVDLADGAARAALLQRSLQGAASALVITEGLLGYLDEESVRALVRDLRAARFWITDMASPAMQRSTKAQLRRQLTDAPLRFMGSEDGVAWFERLGWTARDIRSVLREARRFHRVPFFLLPIALLLREPDPRRLGRSRWYAVVRFERA